MSKAAGLAFLIAVAASSGTGLDPTSLVARLGAPKYVDREAAATELEKLGRVAVPVLKAARNDPDPEIKNRAEVVIASIERSLLTRPTRVSLEAKTYTAAELAALLGSLQSLDLGVVEGNELAPPARRSIEITLPAELGFWEVADRLGMTLQWDVENSEYGRPMMMANRISTSVKLVPKPLRPWPVFDSGPFRVILGAPHFAVENSGIEVQNRTGRPFFNNSPSPVVGGESLVIPLEVWAEPRLALRTAANMRITEAINEHDESVAENLKGEIDPTNSAYNNRSVSTVRTRLRLKTTGTTPARLKTLKGTIPVEVEARRFEPILIPIPTPAQEEQKPVACGTTSVQVHGLSNNIPFGGFRGGGQMTNGLGVDMTIRRDGWSFIGIGGRQGMGLVGQALSSDKDRFWDNIEVIDAQGHAYKGGTRRALTGEGDGIHLIYSLDARDAVGPPTHLRYYEGIRTTVEVPFEFHNIKLR